MIRKGVFIMKKDAVIFAAALALMSFSGCSEKDNSSSSEGNEYQPETTSAVTEALSVPETKEFDISSEIDFPEMDYINEIEYKNGKMVISGIRNSGAVYRKRFILRDLDSGYEKVMNFDEFNAVEYAAVVPDGIAVVYINGTGNHGIAVVDRNTEKILRNVTSADSKDYYISRMFVTEKGDIVLIKQDYEGLYSDTYPHHINAVADIYSSDLRSKETIDLNTVCQMTENDRFGDFCAAGNSLFFSEEITAEEGSEYRINEISLEDFSLINSFDFPVPMNSPLIFADSGGDLCVIPDIYSGDDIFEYYRLNGAENTFKRFTAEISDHHMLRPGNSEYDLVYIGDDDGQIYGYSFETGESTLLCGFSGLDTYYTGIITDTDLSIYGNTVFMMDSTYYSDDKLVICSMDPDGSDRKYTLFNCGDAIGSGFSKICTDSNNNIYGFRAVETSAVFSDDYDADAESTDEYVNSQDQYTICLFTAGKSDPAEATDISDIIGPGEFVTADWMSVDKSGNICLVYHTDGTLGLGMTFILITDMSGNKIFHSSVTESCSSAYYDPEKGMLVTAGFKGIEVFFTDLISGTVKKSDRISSDIRGERIARIYPGDEKYDFYCSDIRQLYGFAIDDNLCEKVFSRDDQYDHNYDITLFCPVSGDEYCCQAYRTDNRPCFLLMSLKK